MCLSSCAGLSCMGVMVGPVTQPRSPGANAHTARLHFLRAYLALSWFADMLPIGRLASLAEAASSVLWLASAEAAFVVDHARSRWRCHRLTTPRAGKWAAVDVPNDGWQTCR